MEQQYDLSDGIYTLTAVRTGKDGKVAYASADITFAKTWDEVVTELKKSFQKYRYEDYWRDYEKGASCVEYDFDVEFGLMKTRINIKSRVGRGEAEAFLKSLSRSLEIARHPATYLKPA